MENTEQKIQYFTRKTVNYLSILIIGVRYKSEAIHEDQQCFYMVVQKACPYAIFEKSTFSRLELPFVFRYRHQQELN